MQPKKSPFRDGEPRKGVVGGNDLKSAQEWDYKDLGGSVNSSVSIRILLSGANTDPELGGK